jgi:orotidine-5'-phosphate decarboxylase
MTRAELVQLIKDRKSYLCVGLDTDPEKIPAHLKGEEDPVYSFNKAIIDATKDLCVSYKINTAFYESQGWKGWQTMEKTVSYIGKDHFLIADAKRGDIGNTSTQYAKAFFEQLPFDSITVAPYMGQDSVRPFLEYAGKWAIVLGLTSNPGSADFELQTLSAGPGTGVSGSSVAGSGEASEKLYERVLRTVSSWGKPDNLMFVVGATQSDEFLHIRKIIPDHFLLVPGVGAQGGSLEEISQKAMNADTGILVNVSRGIIFAGEGKDFDKAARKAAMQYQQEMAGYLQP